MAFCPNFADEEVTQQFNILKEKVGENAAYWYWDRFKGDWRAIQNTLTTSGVRVTPDPDRSQVSPVDTSTAVYTKILEDPKIPKKNTKTWPIGNDNNKAIWDVENELGLVFWKTVNGQKIKFYNAFTKEDAKKIQTYILQNYIDVKVNRSNPAWTKASNEVSVTLTGTPLNVDKEIARHKAMLENQVRIERDEMDKETREDLLPDPMAVNIPTDTKNRKEELKNIRQLTNKFGRKSNTGKEVLEYIREYGTFDGRLDKVLTLIEQNESKLKDVVFKRELQVKIIESKEAVPGHEGDYGYYNPENNSIYLLEEQIHNLHFADYEFFISSVLHEYIHAFTLGALRNPSTDQTKMFAKEMNNLYDVALKNTKNPELYGFTNVEEFVSEIMTSSEFVEELKSQPFNWWQRFVKVIGKFFGINLFETIDETVFRTVMDIIPNQRSYDPTGTVAAKKGPPIAKDILNKIKHNIDITDREGTEKLLLSIKDDYIIKKGESTRHKPTNWPMLGVTTVMKEFGLGISKEELEGNETLQQAGERGSSIGDVVHGIIEHILGKEKDIANELGFTSSVGLRHDLTDILRMFEGEEITVISELFIANPYKTLNGKIDLVVIDSKDRIHLYDFKTKEKGFDDWNRRPTNSYDQSLNYSPRQLAHAQLTIYKRMFEEVTGLPVYSLNAIMLEPTIEEKKITGVKLSKRENGIDSWNVDSNEGSRIYKSIKNTEVNKNEMDEFLSKLPGIENPHISYEIETKLRGFRYSALEFSQAEKTLEKLFKELDKKLTFTKERGTRREIEQLEDKIEEVRRQDETLDSIKVLINFAMKETGEITQLFKNKRRDKEEVSIGQLFHWKNVVLAYEGFGDYIQFLATETPLIDVKTEAGKKKKPEYEEMLEQLNKIMDRVALIENWYKTEGMPKIARYLTPFYGELRAAAKHRWILQYRNNPDAREGLTEVQFVKRGLKAEEKNIDEDTFKLLMKELQKASRDIGIMGLWFDNLLDSRDPVTAAMVESFAKIEDLSHKQSIRTRDELLKDLREFEKKIGDRTGTVSYKKLYDYMLEKNEKGEHSGYFVKGRFNSSIWEERDETGKLIGGYMHEVQETRNLPDDEREEARRAWKDKRTTMRKEEFRQDRWRFIQDIYNDKDRGYELNEIDLITLDQHDKEVAIVYAERIRDKSIPKPPSLQDLANRGGIPQELADVIDDWVYKNAWEYRDIRPEYKDKYESKQWPKLMKHKEANDVEWVLYEKLMALMDEANSVLPFASRIAGRLPGVEKRTTEMIKDNMGIVATIRESFKKEVGIRPDDPEYDNFSHKGEEKTFLPIHYVGKVDMKLQSFDIPTIVYKFWQSSNDFHNKLEILPEMELAKYFIQTRDVDPIGIRRTKLGKRARNKEEMKANNNNLSKQVSNWFSMAVYGQPKKKEGTIVGFDVGKLADALNKYTSLNLLGLNFIQGTANATLAEVLQVTEQIAGEYLKKGSYIRGRKFYLANFPGILGDVGARGAKNVVTRILEEADVLDEWEGTIFSKRQKFRHALSTNTAFFTTHAGEHMMQGTFYLSRLYDKRAINDAGEDIGSMLHQYYVDKQTGELKINSEVNLEKSDWTKDDQFDFQYQTRGILSRIHGEYSELGKMAAQRYALGRLGVMFRKFVVPGFKRRWGRKGYINRLDDFVEGNYVSTGKFIGKLGNDLIHLKFEVGANWHKMTDHEKANVRRTFSEVAFLLVAIIMSNLVIKKLKEDDEDERLWSFLAYQALRLRAELLFFIKPDETMSILRSPAAAMSVAENLIRLSGQMFHPAEIYERGPWKGQPKIYKSLVNMTPFVRQYYRLRDQRDQLSWFSSKIN